MNCSIRLCFYARKTAITFLSVTWLHDSSITINQYNYWYTLSQYIENVKQFMLSQLHACMPVFHKVWYACTMKLKFNYVIRHLVCSVSILDIYNMIMIVVCNIVINSYHLRLMSSYTVFTLHHTW